MSAPVTLSIRQESRNPGHVTISVFAGRIPGRRGHCGTLVFRTDEWDELDRHVIELRDGDFTIQHAFTERFNGSLFDCLLSNWPNGDIGVRGRYVLNDDWSLGDEVQS